jgi:AraC family transcriptional regulator of adaptative response / DNA-3-methyladenine glycosylase II
MLPSGMVQDPDALYSALSARDARFDGVFYVGVTSTGIYCRPVCTARTPKRANCRFFPSAEAAERSSFRPCLRCRPELAPGHAPVDDAHRIGALIAQRIAEGAADEGEGIEEIARQFGWSSRQIRRMLRTSLGVSPMELVLTRRLLLAKQLLTETDLPITEVAFASGFASLRRFNDAFGTRYGMPPTRFRRATRLAEAPAPGEARGTLSLLLSYRTPFDWPGILAFLRKRALAGVESVPDDACARTVRLGAYTGWVRVMDLPARRALSVELPQALTPVLPALLGRLRHVFDLAARPDVIDAQFAADATLGPLVARAPGLRVPGAFDGFELAMRAILGQQVTVKAAATIAGRFAARFGEPLDLRPLAPDALPPDGLSLLSPTPARVAAASVDEVASLGVPRARAASMIALAEEVAAGRLRLEPGAPPDGVMAQLTALPGIGAWTAGYIAMRALRDPDAFPRGDVALQKALGEVSASRADELSQAWRPWRSYATLHLWRSLAPS